MKAKHPLAPFFRRGLGVGVERFLKCCRPVQPHLNLTCLNAEPDDPEEFSQLVLQVCQLYEDAPALYAQGVHLVSTDDLDRHPGIGTGTSIKTDATFVRLNW